MVTVMDMVLDMDTSMAMDILTMGDMEDMVMAINIVMDMVTVMDMVLDMDTSMAMDILIMERDLLMTSWQRRGLLNLMLKQKQMLGLDMDLEVLVGMVLVLEG